MNYHSVEEGQVSKAIDNSPKSEIAASCRWWKISEMALFGSVVREDFRADSDIDVLVSFAPDAEWCFLDHVRMEQELEGILGRKVDLVTRKAVERSGNRARREAVLSAARIIHAA
ncbi:MAG: nucleotidyltransferase family protein [Deltaproteobacteria bacterium]|nr:nucleotidyltransferase family protein [Deltaproteobacteria bacterium]